LQARFAILVSIPEATAFAMLIEMPELGAIEHKALRVSPASPRSPATPASAAASASSAASAHLRQAL
jgi:hypothetical protein